MVRWSLVVLVAASQVAAQDLKPAQEEAKAKFDKEVDAALKEMNAACGTSATVKSDFQNFSPAAWKNISVPVWCKNVISSVTYICKNQPPYKKAIARDLKGFDCTFQGIPAKSDQDKLNTYSERHLEFSNGTFTVRMNPEHRSNIDKAAETVIKKALDK